jgi:hypothetical protein
MIFETDKFEFEMGRVGTLHGSNGFVIKYKCSKETCEIKYGIRANLSTIHVANEKAEQFIVDLIKKHIKGKDAKIERVARGKQKNSTYLSIMETLI